MKSGGLALRVAGVAEMAMLLHLRPATLRENTPQTLRAGVGFSRLFRLVKPPLRLKKPPRFLQPAFAGCNTLHLASKESVPDFPSGLPLGRACALLPAACDCGEKAVPVTVPHRFRGHPKTTVITVTTVTAHKNTRRKRKELNAYALRNPAFSETQGRLCGCL